MKPFYLKIIACNKVFYDGECQMVVLPASDGELGVLSGHEDMTATIEEGIMRIQHTDGSWEKAYVLHGLAEVRAESVNIIVFYAEKPENVESLKAHVDYDQALEEMLHKQSIQEYEQSQARMARALAKLKRSYEPPMGK